MAHQNEPWKRKEPGARLSERDKENQIRSFMEREEMERKASTPVFLWFIGDSMKTFFKMTDASYVRSFQATLRKPLTVAEIRKRMDMAFGDL